MITHLQPWRRKETFESVAEGPQKSLHLNSGLKAAESHPPSIKLGPTFPRKKTILRWIQFKQFGSVTVKECPDILIWVI